MKGTPQIHSNSFIIIFNSLFLNFSYSVLLTSTSFYPKQTQLGSLSSLITFLGFSKTFSLIFSILMGVGGMREKPANTYAFLPAITFR